MGTTILSFQNRVVIETLNNEGRSLRYIANYLGFSKTTVFNELHRLNPLITLLPVLDEVIELLTGRGEIFGLANLFELTDDITAVCLANVAVKIALKMNPAPLKLGLRVVSLNGALKSDHTIRDK